MSDQKSKQNDLSNKRSGVQAEGWQTSSLLVIILLCAFFIILLRRAWFCDDAYITFRTIDNLINGYRLTWNISERVQVFTHPLWMLLLSVFYFFTHEIYYTGLAISITISLITVIILVRRFSLPSAAPVALLILLLSKAFVDFSTSGLENPLSHLLILVFFIQYFKDKKDTRWLFRLSFIASLGITTRMDLALVFLPALAVAFIKNFSWKSLGWMVLGQAPFILWELFATFYYGFPFPNTAYAKLNTGIDTLEYIRQGLFYLLNSVRFDTVTPIAILFSVAASLLNRGRRNFPLVFGCLLYLAYVIKIGGDFMSGRFLTIPLFCAVLLIARLDFSTLNPTASIAIYGALLLVGLNVVNPTVRINDLGPIDSGPIHQWDHGILDERMLYYGGTGLLNAPRDEPMPTFYWGLDGEKMRTTGQKVVQNYGIGMFAFRAGPDVYVLDKLALADPLLARLPAYREVGWRIGHFERILPEGYLQTLQVGKNMIADPALAEYYDKLCLITRGGLFDPARLVEIWKMNTGQYNNLIDRDVFRYPGMVRINYADVSSEAEPADCQSAGAVVMQDSGMEIVFPEAVKTTRLEIALDHNDSYLVEYYLNSQKLAQQIIPTALLPDPGGISARTVAVPSKTASSGFDRVRIFPYTGDASYCLGSFIIR